MKMNLKARVRSNRTPITVATEKWHAIDADVQALKTEFAPVLQPLTETERRDLLTMGPANEAFTGLYATLIEEHADLVPAMLHPADTLRDWQTRKEMAERHRELLLLVQQIEDTLAALQSDCYAAALSAYRVLVLGNTPAGMDPALAPLREHVAERVQRRRETRAANLALKAAEEALATATSGSGTPVNSTTPTNAAAVVVPISAPAGGPIAPPLAQAA